MAGDGYVAGVQRFFRRTAVWATVFWIIAIGLKLYDATTKEGQTLVGAIGSYSVSEALLLWATLFAIFIPLMILVEIKMRARRFVRGKMSGAGAPATTAAGSAPAADPFAPPSPDRFTPPTP